MWDQAEEFSWVTSVNLSCARVTAPLPRSNGAPPSSHQLLLQLQASQDAVVCNKPNTSLAVVNDH